MLTSIKSHVTCALDNEPSHLSTSNDILDAIRAQITSCFQEKSSDEPSTVGEAPAKTGDLDEPSMSGEASANTGDLDEAIDKQDEVQFVQNNESVDFDDVT